MRLGILQTGHVNPALVGAHGEYPPMFERLFDGLGLTFDVYDLLDGVSPDRVDAADGWLITGSKHGVYDDLPWIAPLEDFLRRAYAAGIPLVGVCFGHQILAQALGGRVEKSDKGWGCGVHAYDVHAPEAFGAAAPAQFALHAMHQDQVVSPPKDAQVIASSEFCEFAALAYGDLAAPKAISLQPHPEFDAAFEGALIRLRRGAGVPEEVADAALATLGAPVDAAWTARWIVAFLETAAARAEQRGASNENARPETVSERA